MISKLLSEEQAIEVKNMMLADRLVRIKFGEGGNAISVYEDIDARCETVSLSVTPGPHHELFGKQANEWFTTYEHFLIEYGLSIDGLPLRP